MSYSAASARGRLLFCRLRLRLGFWRAAAATSLRQPRIEVSDLVTDRATFPIEWRPSCAAIHPGFPQPRLAHGDIAGGLAARN
jgi:hypothetical protein